jgi:hypothetical protein
MPALEPIGPFFLKGVDVHASIQFPTKESRQHTMHGITGCPVFLGGDRVVLGKD